MIKAVASCLITTLAISIAQVSYANTPLVPIDPITSSAIINGVNNGMRQRLIPPGEQQLFLKIRSIANDFNSMYKGVGNDPVAAQQIIKANIQNNVAQVVQIASAYYGANSSRVVMAENLYILMIYDSLSRYNPTFQWSKLGIFVANMVRMGLAESFTLQGSINNVIAISPNTANLGIGGLSLTSVASIAGNASKDLIQGQLSVVEDIGTYDLLDARFGAANLINMSTLTPEAKQGFVYLAQAEAASANTKSTTYLNAATNAAVQFGIHEQKYLLQPMWDLPLMKTFADVNAAMLNLSLGVVGLASPNIYLGSNQILPPPGPYLTILAPWGSSNVALLNSRIAIATNGFKTLTQWRQVPLYSNYIDQSQANLGNANGIYQPIGF